MTELLEYINNPTNVINNFNLGIYYEKLNHYSPASCFYLRCADMTKDIDLRYECLLRLFICYRSLENRLSTCESILRQAISLCPRKPEAYFFLTQVYESRSDWMNVYTYSSIGLAVCDMATTFHNTVHFPGLYGLIFQKAASAWWIGKSQEARNLYQILLNNYIDEMDDYYKTLLEKNLSSLGSGSERIAIRRYNKSLKDRLKFSFDGIETVTDNFSQVYQDLFILTILNGKKHGAYLEIGSSDAFKNSNTALLETKFAWTGVGIEFNPDLANTHKNQRKNPVLCTDALIVDYKKLLSKYFPDKNIIEYLQLDIEPPRNTYEALLSIPFDKYKFAVITYEHDYYVDITRSYREKSRDYLESKGYLLVVPNISPTDSCPFEDWWVHPDLVDMNIVKNIIANTDPGINPVEKFFLNN